MLIVAHARLAYRRLFLLSTALLVCTCGIIADLYLATNQLPNAKLPAVSHEAKAQPASKPQAEATIPAAVLRNPATDSPAEMILDGSQF